MGTWLRDLNGYRRSYRQHITFAELVREFPQMCGPRAGALVPDPWDDYSRRDLDDRSWKRHRLTRYKLNRRRFAKRPRSKVVYESPWIERGRCNFGFMNSGCLVQFRVRLSYRRHRE
jgi:hypothetical protein